MLGKVDTSFLAQKYLPSHKFLSERNIVNKKKVARPNTKLEVSRFTYAFQKHNIVALYHSLTLGVVYLPRSMFNAFFYLTRKRGVAKPFLRDDKYDKDVDEILKKLFCMDFLVSDNHRDELLLFAAQKKFLQPSLRKLYIIATNRCNLKCRYCYLGRHISDGGASMDIKTAKRGVDLFVALLQKHFLDSGRASVCFYGGEPLLNFQMIKPTVKYLNSLKGKVERLSDLKIEVITNGTLITWETARFFKKEGVGINLSIDGGSLKTNIHRIFEGGTNSLNVVLKSINILNKIRVPTTLVSTISPQTFPYLGEIINFLTSKSTSSCINILRPNLQLKINHDFIENATKARLNAFKTFRKIGHYEERMAKKVFHFVNKILYPFNNGLGGQEIAIFPNGKIGVCHGCLGDNRYLIGDIKTLNPQKVVSNSVYQEWITRSPLNISKCWECPALGICGGGRPFEVEKRTGNIWDLDRFHCVQSKTVLKWLIWDNFQFET